VDGAGCELHPWLQQTSVRERETESERRRAADRNIGREREREGMCERVSISQSEIPTTGEGAGQTYRPTVESRAHSSRRRPTNVTVLPAY